MAPGWTYADLDLSAGAYPRADGGALNRRDWACQNGHSDAVPVTVLPWGAALRNARHNKVLAGLRRAREKHRSSGSVPS